MRSDQMSVNELEAKWIRLAWWVLPPLLAVLLPLAKGYAWPLISLDPDMAPSLGLRGLAVLAVVGLVLGLAGVALWSWSLRGRGALCASWPWSLAIALLLVVLADFAVRQTAVQDALWSAVRTRGRIDTDFYMREMGLFRRAALRNHLPAFQPRMKVVGSSQLISGVDYDLLQSIRPDLHVERRCVAAMTPARLLMAAPFVGAGPGDTVVVYWSEFDMGGVTTLDVDWYRAFANGPGLRDVLNLLPAGEWKKHARRSVELFWGCASQLWCDREGWRLLASRMLGTMRQTRTKQTREDVVNQQGSGYADGLDNEPYFQMGLQSARRVVQQWREAGADVVILEGNVNPAIHHARTPERRRQTRVFLEDVSRTTGARYIPSENQAYSPSPQDWQDGTHLNKEASLAFTRYLATLIPGPSPESP